MTSFGSKISAFASLVGLTISNVALAQEHKGYKVEEDARVTFSLKDAINLEKDTSKGILTLTPSKVVQGTIQITSEKIPFYLDYSQIVNDIQKSYDRGWRLGISDSNWLLQPKFTFDTEGYLDALEYASKLIQYSQIDYIGQERKLLNLIFDYSLEKKAMSPSLQDSVGKSINYGDLRLTKQKLDSSSSMEIVSPFEKNEATENNQKIDPSTTIGAIVILGLALNRILRKKQND